MQQLLSQRIADSPSSFIREILKLSSQPEIISFAGGLPDPDMFPHKQLAEASAKIFQHQHASILQYSHTEGDIKLREWIANRYHDKHGLNISAEDILITTGSQQALDLLGKCLIDAGDDILIEQPSYLGAIQAFSIYQPNFLTVKLNKNGVDTGDLAQHLSSHQPKLFYCVPEFQNPSGISHSSENRQQVATLLSKRDTLLIEDNPYGDLHFNEISPPSYYQMIPEQTVLLGSFSKTLAPSLRLGWVVAPKWLMKKLIIAKQSTDLHSSNLLQAMVYQYLINNNFDQHVAKTSRHYQHQMMIMRKAIETHFPKSVVMTYPNGGMFLWCSMPDGNCSMQLFEQAIQHGVAFVPGTSFTINGQHSPSFRLNFTNSREEAIWEGISRLGKLMKKQGIK